MIADCARHGTKQKKTPRRNDVKQTTVTVKLIPRTIKKKTEPKNDPTMGPTKLNDIHGAGGPSCPLSINSLAIGPSRQRRPKAYACGCIGPSIVLLIVVRLSTKETTQHEETTPVAEWPRG